MELYVHIPFCRQKCRYCSFTSHAGTETDYEEYINLLLQEAEIRKNEPEEAFKTVYIGGGTPSVLPPSLFDKMSEGLRNNFDLTGIEEYTVEANPGTVTPEWLDTALKSGVNRLSLGMQAFQPKLLSLLGRIHCFESVKESVFAARQSGFRNINLDLIFGIPGQRISDWQETLEAALSLSPEHISAYGLIPEEGTPLKLDLDMGILQLPDPDEERQMYSVAIDMLRRHGLFQYEISNFARAGFECHHNIGYWTQIPYMGLGLSAASMTGIRYSSSGMSYDRRTNPDSMKNYIHMLNHMDSVHSEKIFPKEARFETMMLGLRLNRGIHDEDFQRMHGVSVEACYGDRLRKMMSKGLIQHEDHYWRLTSRGFDIQNSILVELME